MTDDSAVIPLAVGTAEIELADGRRLRFCIADVRLWGPAAHEATFRDGNKVCSGQSSTLCQLHGEIWVLVTEWLNKAPTTKVLNDEQAMTWLLGTDYPLAELPSSLRFLANRKNLSAGAAAAVEYGKWRSRPTPVVTDQERPPATGASENGEGAASKKRKRHRRQRGRRRGDYNETLHQKIYAAYVAMTPGKQSKAARAAAYDAVALRFGVAIEEARLIVKRHRARDGRKNKKQSRRRKNPK